VSAITEHCSVCEKEFDVMFRYQMEERDGGFVFFCSQDCLGKSQAQADRGESGATCDACAKHFRVTLASQVFYAAGRRRYACSMPCRTQLVREVEGVRLGEIAADEHPREAVAESPRAPSSDPPPAMSPRATAVRSVPTRPSRVPTAEPATPQPPSRKTRPVAMAMNTNKAPRRIAVFNHKGGTGKTTTSVSLAAGLADAGHRVLLLDTDSQGNVAVSLGAKSERSLYHVLVMGLRVADAITNLRPNLDLLPSNETLAAAELYLAGKQNRDRVLRQRMEKAVDDYDYVIIDCSPSLSLMNQNALCLADSVLVPVACDYLSLVGVRQVIKTVKNVNSLLRHPLRIWGVLPTFYDQRAKICTEALETLRTHFGQRCLRPIRATTKLKEAPAQARSIFEHAPGTHGAEDYEALVETVLEAGAARASDRTSATSSVTAQAQAI
jgi:chromosome partitioning protein